MGKLAILRGLGRNDEGDAWAEGAWVEARNRIIATAPRAAESREGYAAFETAVREAVAEVDRFSAFASSSAAPPDASTRAYMEEVATEAMRWIAEEVSRVAERMG